MVTVEYKIKNGPTVGYHDFKELKILTSGKVKIYCESYDDEGYIKPFATIEDGEIESILIEFLAEECYEGCECSDCVALREARTGRMKPIMVDGEYECTNCKSPDLWSMRYGNRHKYCGNCGQLQDWSVLHESDI